MKPPGYWTDFSNIEHELSTFMAALDHKNGMPSKREFIAHRRTDLLLAIQRYGGLKYVANLLNLPTSTTYKSSGYWNDFENVTKELLQFITTYGEEGVMPQQDDFVKYSFSSLGESLLRHGGHAVVAQKLRLRMPQKVKPSGYWHKFENIETELTVFMERYGFDGIMPSLKDLADRDQLGLAGAISRMGGFTAIAQRLQLRNAIPTAPRRWKDFQTLERELEYFMKEHHMKDVMVTSAQLQDAKRYDLVYAIGCFGGYKAVADKLHLTYVKSSRYKASNSNGS